MAKHLYFARCPGKRYVSGVASHFGFVSLPHFLGSSLCIFSIAFAVSGCFSITCFVMAWTISFHDTADSFCSQGPPNDRHVIVFIRHLGALLTDAMSEWRGCWRNSAP